MLKDYKNNVRQQAIDDALLIDTDLWTVKNLFDDEILEEIVLRLDNEKSWTAVEMQEHLNRKCLPWNKDEIVADIWSMINTLDFSKFGFNLQSLTVWKDSEGYTIGDHSDNERVVGAMQIYLNTVPKELGTWFGKNEIPFVKNTGYIMNNKNKPRHGMKTMVPPNITRYSLYVYFDLKATQC